MKTAFEPAHSLGFPSGQELVEQELHNGSRVPLNLQKLCCSKDCKIVQDAE